jgi:hypothetical protein
MPIAVFSGYEEAEGVEGRLRTNKIAMPAATRPMAPAMLMQAAGLVASLTAPAQRAPIGVTPPKTREKTLMTRPR